MNGEADTALNDAVAAYCERRAALRLRTSDGSVVEGTALDTQSDGDSEFLVLTAPGRRFLVRMSAIVTIETR